MYSWWARPPHFLFLPQAICTCDSAVLLLGSGRSVPLLPGLSTPPLQLRGVPLSTVSSWCPLHPVKQCQSFYGSRIASATGGCSECPSLSHFFEQEEVFHPLKCFNLFVYESYWVFGFGGLTRQVSITTEETLNWKVVERLPINICIFGFNSGNTDVGRSVR
jgi:hypothetical protein